MRVLKSKKFHGLGGRASSGLMFFFSGAASFFSSSGFGSAFFASFFGSAFFSLIGSFFGG